MQKFWKLVNTQSGIWAESGGGNLSRETDTVAVRKAGSRKWGFPKEWPWYSNRTLAIQERGAKQGLHPRKTEVFE